MQCHKPRKLSKLWYPHHECSITQKEKNHYLPCAPFPNSNTDFVAVVVIKVE